MNQYIRKFPYKEQPESCLQWHYLQPQFSVGGILFHIHCSVKICIIDMATALKSLQNHTTEYIYCILLMSVALHMQNETTNSQMISMYFPSSHFSRAGNGNHSNNNQVHKSTEYIPQLQIKVITLFFLSFDSGKSKQRMLCQLFFIFGSLLWAGLYPLPFFLNSLGLGLLQRKLLCACQK